jgi:hypothetical protein
MLLKRPSRRPSRLASLAPQGDGNELGLVELRPDIPRGQRDWGRRKTAIERFDESALLTSALELPCPERDEHRERESRKRERIWARHRQSRRKSRF